MRPHAIPLAAASAVLLTLTGCGGSADHAAKSASPSPKPTPTVPAANAAALQAAVQLQKGFGTPTGSLELHTTADTPADDAHAKADVARGMLYLAVEHLDVHLPQNDAVRDVMEFKDAAGAAASVAHFTDGTPVNSTVRLAVPGVPGARGAIVKNGNEIAHANVAFAVGRFVYALGFGHAPGAQGPRPARLVASARAWYAAIRKAG